MREASSCRFATIDAADVCCQCSEHVLVSVVGQSGPKDGHQLEVVPCLLTARMDTNGHQTGHHFGHDGHQWTQFSVHSCSMTVRRRRCPTNQRPSTALVAPVPSHTVSVTKTSSTRSCWRWTRWLRSWKYTRLPSWGPVIVACRHGSNWRTYEERFPAVAHNGGGGSE